MSSQFSTTQHFFITSEDNIIFCSQQQLEKTILLHYFQCHKWCNSDNEGLLLWITSEKFLLMEIFTHFFCWYSEVTKLLHFRKWVHPNMPEVSMIDFWYQSLNWIWYILHTWYFQFINHQNVIFHYTHNLYLIHNSNNLLSPLTSLLL